ncbi:MAG: hypothetical protein HQM10_11030 [Candidatus Riflebacteria bacterium]|nr:hypothetical protein [Candidatus Riflebacteria bacterium]
MESRIRFFAACFAGFLLALVIVQFTSYEPFNLIYRGEPFFHQGVRIQSLRDLVYSSFEYKRYFGLLNLIGSSGKCFPASELLQTGGSGHQFDRDRVVAVFSALGVPEKDIKDCCYDSVMSPALLAFIGSGNYVFPFPDPYRLPLVDLKPDADLKTVFPELNLSLKGTLSSKFVEKAVLADLPILDEDFPALPRLSLGILVRAIQEAQRVEKTNAEYHLGLLMIFIIGLLLSAIFAFIIETESWFAKIPGAVTILCIALLFMSPSFNRTRAVGLDFQKLSANDMIELKREAMKILDLLEKNNLLKTERLPVSEIKRMIENPPINR